MKIKEIAMELDELIKITNHYEDRLRHWEMRYHERDSIANRERVAYYNSMVKKFNELLYNTIQSK